MEDNNIVITGKTIKLIDQTTGQPLTQFSADLLIDDKYTMLLINDLMKIITKYNRIRIKN